MPPPSKPASFAVSVSGSLVTLTWADVATETSYYLYRVDEAGVLVQTIKPAGTTSHVETPADGVYQYALLAHSDVHGDSDLAGIDPVTVAAGASPGHLITRLHTPPAPLYGRSAGWGGY